MEHIRVNDKTRLELVKLDMAPVIFETINRDREYLKEWLPFVNHTFAISDTERFLKNVTDTGRDEIYSIWFNEEFAGLIGYKDTDWVNKKTELGYWLARKLQGRGIVTACVEKLCRFAFQKMKMHRIQIKVAVENAKSEAIPVKLNFSFEGIERGGELHENEYIDLKVYSLLSNDPIPEQ